MRWTLPVDSSVFRSAAYEEQSCVLELHFRDGAVYRYADVPVHVYIEFTLAQSKGRYFHAQIRHRYSYRQVESRAPMLTPLLA